MTQRVFISYRRDDVPDMAARIRDRLAEALGSTSVFMDVDDLRPGQRFDQELQKALSGTDVFLAVIGPRWVELLLERQASGDRDYVHEEIAACLARGTPVVPVLIERVPMPRPESLPEDIRDLTLHQKHEVGREQFGRDMAGLVEAVTFLKRSGSKPRPPLKRSQRTMRLGLIAIPLALASVIGGVFVFGEAAPWPLSGLAGFLGSHRFLQGHPVEPQARRSTDLESAEKTEEVVRARLAAQIENDRLFRERAEAARLQAAAEFAERQRAEEERRHLAALQAERERLLAAELAEAKRKVEDAERQRVAAQIESERQARLKAEAESEAARRALEAREQAEQEREQRRQAAALAEQKRQAERDKEAAETRRKQSEPLVFPVLPAPAGTPFSVMQRPIDNLFAAWNNVDVGHYMAQWARDGQRIDKARGTRQTYDELRADRMQLFASVSRATARYNVEIRQWGHDKPTRFAVGYSLTLHLKSGRTHQETGCQNYQVEDRGGRWLIVLLETNVACS